MVSEDDEIPPLEDLSEEITKKFNIKQKTKTSFLEVDSDYEIQKRREKQMKDLIVAKPTTKKDCDIETKSALKSTSNETYCGFKKGFLTNGKNTEKKKMKSKEKIVEIKPSEDAKDSKVLPEVQQAMQGNIPLLQSTATCVSRDFILHMTALWNCDDFHNLSETGKYICISQDCEKNFKTAHDSSSPDMVICTWPIDESTASNLSPIETMVSHFDWVTDNLLEKVTKNPKLAKQFVDPNFSEAIQLFQSNPQKVMDMCQNNKELREFIQEFCALMGDHFTKLGEKQETQRVRSGVGASIAKSPASKEDEAKIQAIISDPEVATILQNPDIQKLLTALKKNSTSVQRILKNADSSLCCKIQKLIDVGLLQFTCG